MNYNRVMLMGRLTRDPETRYTPKGTAVCQVGLAVNRKWKGQDGQDNDETLFVDVECFGRTAEVVGQYLAKGSGAFIEGRLKLDQWDDKQTGQKRSKLKVIADTVQFINGGERRERAAQDLTPSDEPGQQDQSAGDDNIPF